MSKKRVERPMRVGLVSKRKKRYRATTESNHGHPVAPVADNVLKTGCVFHEDFVSRAHARSLIFEFIEVSYNRKRRHSFLGYKTPE